MENTKEKDKLILEPFVIAMNAGLFEIKVPIIHNERNTKDFIHFNKSTELHNFPNKKNVVRIGPFTETYKFDTLNVSELVDLLEEYGYRVNDDLSISILTVHETFQRNESLFRMVMEKKSEGQLETEMKIKDFRDFTDKIYYIQRRLTELADVV